MWLCPSNADARYLSGHFFVQKSFCIYDSNFRGIVRQGSAVYILFIINCLACRFPTRGLTRLAVRLAEREDPCCAASSRPECRRSCFPHPLLRKGWGTADSRTKCNRVDFS